MNDDRKLQTVVLAAMLHDIGKFAQRTGRHAGRSHPELSTWFVSEYLGNEWEEVAHAVGYHHLPAATSARDVPLALTLVLADWMSSGERRELPAGETGEPGNDALVSIFSRLTDGGTKTSYPLRVLPADGKLEPAPGVTTGRESYRELWDSFVAECQTVRRDDAHLLTAQLLSVLEKYTMFVPSAAWKSETDISLYHHLKSTAAIASCLHLDGLSAADLDALIKAFDTTDRPVAMLVGGDVSGIQSFIYNLRAKGALKSLRGRSLYLQLLPEAIAGLLLAEFGLTRANLLYCGGGHFYVLVPAVTDAEARLAGIVGRVEKTLLNAHGGRLGVALAMQELRPRDFRRQDFGLAWDGLHLRLAREKRRRFSRLLAEPEGLRLVLGPPDSGGEKPACSVCGDETDNKGGQGQPLCSMCASFADLSSSLREAAALVEVPTDRREEQTPTWFDVLANVGCEYSLEHHPQRGTNAWLLNGTDFVQAGFNGFRFLAKHVPEGTEGTATLEELADHADGINRWGVLRLDVDNLGETFKTGLGADRSISRLSMLSYLLGYFSSARVQAVAREDEYKDKVYLAYSGGDDLFAIGPWSILPGFAERIKDDFVRFTSGRLTVSAGIFVAPSARFPVYEAADEAGNAEAESKTTGRNRLTFLDTALGWSDLPKVVAIKDGLVGLLKDELPRSILGILRSSWQQQAEARDGRIPMYPVWRLLYAFKRLKERHKGLALRIDDLEKQVTAANGLHPRLDLIIRWADYEVRR